MACTCLDHYFELAKPDSRAVNFLNPDKNKKIHNPDHTWYVSLAAQFIMDQMKAAKPN